MKFDLCLTLSGQPEMTTFTHQTEILTGVKAKKTSKKYFRAVNKEHRMRTVECRSLFLLPDHVPNRSFGSAVALYQSILIEI